MNESKQNEPLIRKREILTLSEWRATQVGMWAWLLQRFTALGTVLFVTLHLVYPYQVILQSLLALCICIHAVLGIRVIILDLRKQVAIHRILFAVLMILGLLLFLIILKYRIYYF